MKKICCVLAAMATIALVAPSIASAQDKPMMKEGMTQDGMKKPMMHHRMSHKMMKRHKMMRHHHKMMKKEM